ncbi:hypothetical protein OB955_18470 [Halobacteria archaeon AArc-m2/3/4]|uniref:Uncharacterized protein n=1 Tax=Natronoglomus mannanivorans TaxID=2979990 RepID=A0AAP2Z1W1_9EURY|nr:hypothetical protein [Halobacteria archaeon AArc-xg1-1]MCU4974707.1 hypothetical protein [Halobacteria archaeon AArc-m2/3/4]
MSLLTDGVLGLLALGAFAGALVAVDARLSLPFFALGAAGTAVFEIVAFRNTERVRYYWERPVTQLATFALGLAIAGIGAVVAPSSVLSAGIGAIGAYLVVLVAVLVVRR